MPKTICNTLRQSYSNILLRLHKIDNTIKCPDSNDHMLLLFSSDIKDLPEIFDEFEIIEHTIKFGYNQMSAEEILKELMPADVVVPTGFETIGHIAHFNLKDMHMPYRFLIGQVTMDVSLN